MNKNQTGIMLKNVKERGGHFCPLFGICRHQEATTTITILKAEYQTKVRSLKRKARSALPSDLTSDQVDQLEAPREVKKYIKDGRIALEGLSMERLFSLFGKTD